MGNKISETIISSHLTFKLILSLNDNWETYLASNKYKIREVEKREEAKMLGCMDPERGGYSVYICIECGEQKKIPHSCKSRICSSCGKRHADEWAEKINKEMYAVPYRHIILTVSDRLWIYFEGNAPMQKLMLVTAGEVMKEIVRKFNSQKKKAEPGIIMVLHPFGRDLKTNMHVHMLMTEGGLTSSGEWIEMPYIDYKIIRKKWQYAILTAIRKANPQDKELHKIIDWCFKERTNGFNIQAKRRIEGKTKQAARYMARYVRHPAIADSRIIGYDTQNVTFVYERERKTYTVIKPFSWQKNVAQYTGKDPLKCGKCSGAMQIYKVVYRNRNGELKEYGDLEKFIKKIAVRGKVTDEKEKAQTKFEAIKAAGFYQLCLF